MWMFGWNLLRRNLINLDFKCFLSQVRFKFNSWWLESGLIILCIIMRMNRSCDCIYSSVCGLLFMSLRWKPLRSLCADDCQLGKLLTSYCTNVWTPQKIMSNISIAAIFSITFPHFSSLLVTATCRLQTAQPPVPTPPQWTWTTLASRMRCQALLSGCQTTAYLLILELALTPFCIEERWRWMR